jgi:GT2 family glycosyltransferase
MDRYPLVSIVVPTRGSRGFIRGADRSLVLHALGSLADNSSYPAIEVILVADRATPVATLAALRQRWGRRLRVVHHDGPFNFSAQVNRGVLHSAGELVVLLNDDVEVITPDWLETMAGLALDPGVGMVGAKLLYEDGTLQHIGHLYERNDAAHLAAGAPADWPGMQADLLVQREVSGVTAACAMLRRDVFEHVGGLSPELPINFNDVDLSMKITQAGFRIVVTPYAQLFHFESRSRPRTVTASEVRVLRGRWNRRLQVDPYWRHDPDAVRAEITRFRG